jgi:hypothetical protein
VRARDSAADRLSASAVAANAVVAAQRVINKAPERVFREIGRIRFQ